ncbi:uncharacterized protein LOC123534740 [Mercenaria mercenaria]|uniref:uncharacterized protein LOC123534740 n=1 Tax=Mercenaria mercenaria TaxID=6596 RepID=UPI00234EB7C4|nr:uncharacterized protein LOC123534740 [Mercenaria mercenaria]
MENKFFEEPLAKRQKREHLDPIFQSFAFEEGKRNIKRLCLEKAFSYLQLGINDMNLAILEIIDANPRTSVGFRDAALTTNCYQLKAQSDSGFVLENIFVDGFDVLKKILDAQPKVPKDNLQWRALAKLLQFISEQSHDPLFEEPEYEEQWVFTLAQHLFSKLSVDEAYMVDSAPNFRLQEDLGVCPCKEKDPLIGKIGDTSFGLEAGWHGKADIIMQHVPITVIRERKQYVTSEDLSSSSGEANESFSEKDLTQLRAQTILFSFLQHKLNKDLLKNCLIPGIGMNAKELVIFFYDCENDVLLSSKTLQLFRGKELSLSVVLFLWLTLNYRHFCSGVAEGMKGFKSTFFSKAENYLKDYYSDVTLSLHMPFKKQETEFGWSDNYGIEFAVREPCVDYIELPN